MTAALARPEADRTIAGIALMLAFCVLAPLLDVSAKLASATIPVGQIVVARFLVQFALMVPVMAAMGISWALPPRALALVFLRAFFLIVSTYSFVAAIAVMPVADALAIAFVEPFVVLILGRLLFGDEVGPRRIAASVVGFCGALLVIQPSFVAFGAVALWPLGTAFSFAFYMLVTRHLRQMHPVAMQAQTSLTGLVLCLPLMALAMAVEIPTVTPAMPQGVVWLWLFGVGFWAAVSHMCMTYALTWAPSATLAPLHYLEIVAAVALGYWIFGDFPNWLTWAGIAVIMASGLYLVHRERIAARRRRSAPPVPR